MAPVNRMKATSQLRCIEVYRWEDTRIADYLRMALNSVFKYIVKRPDMIIRCRIGGC